MLRFSKEIDWYHHHQQFLWKWHDILLFQLFGPVLFSAHVYGSSQLVGTRSLVLTISIWDASIKWSKFLEANLFSTTRHNGCIFIFKLTWYLFTPPLFLHHVCNEHFWFDKIFEKSLFRDYILRERPLMIFEFRVDRGGWVQNAPQNWTS